MSAATCKTLHALGECAGIPFAGPGAVLGMVTALYLASSLNSHNSPVAVSYSPQINELRRGQGEVAQKRPTAYLRYGFPCRHLVPAVLHTLAYYGRRLLYVKLSRVLGGEMVVLPVHLLLGLLLCCEWHPH